jgi:hypothetical protein
VAGARTSQTYVSLCPLVLTLKYMGRVLIAYAYAGEGRISQVWTVFAWDATGPGAGWLRGDADSLLVQY